MWPSRNVLQMLDAGSLQFETAGGACPPDSKALNGAGADHHRRMGREGGGREGGGRKRIDADSASVARDVPGLS